MRIVELILCGLLALAALAHLGGTLAGYELGTEIFVWSVSATCFVFLLVFVHVLRIYRPGDRPVRLAAIAGSVVWIGLALAFGAAVGDILDPRALTHAVITFGLLATTLLGPRARAGASTVAA